jgi:hypothetical protein
LFLANSVDIDPTGAGLWPTTGLDNLGSFTGPPSGTVAVSSGLVTVTFNQIGIGASVQYRYKVTVQ